MERVRVAWRPRLRFLKNRPRALVARGWARITKDIELQVGLLEPALKSEIWALAVVVWGSFVAMNPEIPTAQTW